MSHHNKNNCTQTLVKDLVFQRKYKLTSTQTDIMAYLINLPYWAKEINGYLLLVTPKIMSDLKIGLKTIEASFTRLIKLGLITTAKIKVKEWDNQKNYRGVKISVKGQKYNTRFTSGQRKEAELKIAKLELRLAEMEKILAQNPTPKNLESSKNRGNNTLTTLTNKKIIEKAKKEKIETQIEETKFEIDYQKLQEFLGVVVFLNKNVLKIMKIKKEENHKVSILVEDENTKTVAFLKDKLTDKPALFSATHAYRWIKQKS